MSDRSLTNTLADALAGPLADVLAERFAPMVKAELDKALAERPADVREVHVTVNERERVNVGHQHETFPKLVRTIAAGVPVWLCGPAGSGKTVGAEKAAHALSLAFSAVSVGPHTTQAHLMGYMDATGTYRGTEVRTRFECGGVLLLDEIDRGNPGVLTCLNALLANDVCAFPDGMIHRHAEFRVVAAANTIGMGADRQYVGAAQLDAATLDRFALLEWGYDEAFETELAAGYPGWARYVQAVRATVAELKVRHVVSPRATLGGIRLHKAGAMWNEVAEMVLWRGLDTQTRERIEHGTHAKMPSNDLTPPAPSAPIVPLIAPAEIEEPDPLVPDTLKQAWRCPKCSQHHASRHSRIEPSKCFCWKKRGGCGHKWDTRAEDNI